MLFCRPLRPSEAMNLAPTLPRPPPPCRCCWTGCSTTKPATSTANCGRHCRQEFFVILVLQELINLAPNNNRNLRVAAFNIERSRDQYRISAPSFAGRRHRSRQRPARPGDLPAPAAPKLRGRPRRPGVSSDELDLFGRVGVSSARALESIWRRSRPAAGGRSPWCPGGP